MYLRLDNDAFSIHALIDWHPWHDAIIETLWKPPHAIHRVKTDFVVTRYRAKRTAWVGPMTKHLGTRTILYSSIYFRIRLFSGYNVLLLKHVYYLRTPWNRYQMPLLAVWKTHPTSTQRSTMLPFVEPAAYYNKRHHIAQRCIKSNRRRQHAD